MIRRYCRYIRLRALRPCIRYAFHDHEYMPPCQRLRLLPPRRRFFAMPFFRFFSAVMLTLLSFSCLRLYAAYAPYHAAAAMPPLSMLFSPPLLIFFAATFHDTTLRHYAAFFMRRYVAILMMLPRILRFAYCSSPLPPFQMPPIFERRHAPYTPLLYYATALCCDMIWRCRYYAAICCRYADFMIHADVITPCCLRYASIDAAAY